VRFIVIAMVLINIGAFAPAFILGALGLKDAIFVAMLAGLTSFLACFMGSGWKTGLRVSVPFAVFCALTVWAAPYALAAALVLGAAAFWRGYGARLGLHNALMMSVISLGFIVTQPPKFEGSSFSAPVLTGLVALGSFAVRDARDVYRSALGPPTSSHEASDRPRACVQQHSRGDDRCCDLVCHSFQAWVKAVPGSS
jgi:hypothetical protein